MPNPGIDMGGSHGSKWTRRLRFRHLEILVAISQQSSLTQAAEALGITQPAVSQWLADIEAAIGAPLFVRGRRLTPTSIAGPVIAHAKRVLKDAQRTMDDVEAIRDGRLGLVTIGALTGVIATNNLPTAIWRLHETTPDIRISIVEDSISGLWERFDHGEMDVMVTRLAARELASGLRTQLLYVDRYQVVCAPTHPLVDKAQVDWRDAVRYPWVMPPSGTPLRRAIEATFVAAGVPQPEVLLESVTMPASSEIVRSTQALGLSTIGYRQRFGGLFTLPLVLTYDLGGIGAIWRDEGTSPALVRVLSALHEACAEPTPPPPPPPRAGTERRKRVRGATK
jgi:DNA-binding transcriptional LysR family regulator